MVLINDLPLLEAECGIRVHGWGLDEWLELIPRMSGGALNAKNLLDRLLSQDGISETVGDMRELLLLSPLDIELRALIVIVMVRMWAVGQRLLMVKFLGLREPGTGRLPPSVVKVEEHVVQVLVLVTD